MEWKLFTESNPRASSLEFFNAHSWIDPVHQAGHRERTAMAVWLTRKVVEQFPVATISDLGCGDGAFIDAILPLVNRVWGYDAGAANVAKAHESGLDVRQANILSDPLEYGELITCCEVVEHLEHPHEFVASLPGKLLILTSPSAETGDWHYYDHTWAWDTAGYIKMVADAGWTVCNHTEVDGGLNQHCGVVAPQRFQGIFARRT